MTYRMKRAVYRLSIVTVGWLFAAALLTMSGCQGMPYRSDSAALNSAQSNMDETPVFINGRLCVDMDGEVGACTKRIASDESLVVLMPPMPYAYILDVVCSPELDLDFSVDVRANEPYSFTFTPDMFEGWRRFSCKGETKPFDRLSQAVSHRWTVTLEVYDTKYRPREEIYVSDDKKLLVLGSHALHSRVCFVDNEECIECKAYKKKPVLKLRGKRVKYAWSESARARWNFFGL